MQKKRKDKNKDEEGGTQSCNLRHAVVDSFDFGDWSGIDGALTSGESGLS